MSKTVYKEEQRFRRWEVIGLLVLLAISITYHFIELYFNSTYNKGALLSQYSLALMITIGFLIYLLSIRLVLKIDDKKISYQFYPLHYRKHHIRWDEVAAYQVVHTPVSAELSGWAVRIGTWERMYSVCGRTGLRLSLRDGRELFIGSKKPEEIKNTIRKLQA